TLQNNSQSMTITANTQRTSAEQFRSLVIANPNGAPIHLGDIADVQDSFENQYTGMTSSTWRRMFSSMTIASSTTSPT
ncbi:efflux RND transporter permease subunit, partial [Rhizobium ruizarguesonis]